MRGAATRQPGEVRIVFPALVDLVHGLGSVEKPLREIEG